jgi:peptidyl-prolyl cis-trans isomerase A (cyclophilin A)
MRYPDRMIRRFAAIALLCLLATPASAQAGAPPAPTPAQDQAPATAPKSATVHVTLVTTEGTITLELEKERAPITTANFLRYVTAKRLDGMTFYRAMKFGDGGGLVQGGVRNDPKRLFPPIALEPTSRTGLAHLDGTISMARTAPNSATADFFITIGPMPSLDADPKQPGDNLGFAAFGHVVDGMDVIRRIRDAPTSPTEGEGVMKGQMLAPPVRIISARRVD